jgi:hypothetical protein
MVSACPTESDPKAHVEEFLKNDGMRVMSGLRDKGVENLVEVLISEIRKQEPDSNLIILNKDVLSDVCFVKELTGYLKKYFMSDRKNVVVISEPLSLIGWQNAFEPLKGEYRIQVYFTDVACRQIPICCKLF